VPQGVIIERGHEIPHAIFDPDDAIFIIVEIDIPLPILSHVARLVIIDCAGVNGGISIRLGIVRLWIHIIIVQDITLRLVSDSIPPIIHREAVHKGIKVGYAGQPVEIVVTEHRIQAQSYFSYKANHDR
jgi:hypothetical protein